MTTIDSDLASGPFEDDDLEPDPIPVRYQRRLPLLTAILGLAVFAALAFVGGVEIQKHYVGSSASGAGGSAASAFAARFASGATSTTGGTTSGSRGGGFFGAPGGTSG